MQTQKVLIFYITMSRVHTQKISALMQHDFNVGQLSEEQQHFRVLFQNTGYGRCDDEFAMLIQYFYYVLCNTRSGDFLTRTPNQQT